MKLPIGYSDFRAIIDNKFNFVDKSLLIREVIEDSAQVILITRPRRFGKTLNLSMLHYFFAAEAYGESTKGLFANLNITEHAEYMQHQGRYPVIFLSLKDVKDHNFETAYANLCEVMRQLYSEFPYLRESELLAEDEKAVYKSIVQKLAKPEDISASLRNLCKYLARYHGVKPWLLIDEYDTSIQSGFLHGYYDEITGFMRNFFGAGLKDNPYLHKAVITGILRISKESLFSGLNNLKVYSLLNKKYGEYFGFTETEVNHIFAEAKLDQDPKIIKEWYNGYQFGEVVVYNPWSIVNCVVEKGLIQPYWVNTSDNALIKQILVNSSESFKAQFEKLLLGQSNERLVDENVVFADLQKNENAIWSLLLMAGYLKVISYQITERGEFHCELRIPNKEIRFIYCQIIENWLSNGYGIEWYDKFLAGQEDMKPIK